MPRCRVDDPRDVLDPERVADVRKALQALIDGRHTMHVPPQSDDADLVVSRWISEAKRAIRALRAEVG